MNQIQDIVKTYYGETLSGTKDLKTDACTTTDRPPPHVSAALAAVHNEVAGRYYGCGLAIPSVLEGLKLLDLGCGAGRDVFALAKLVGPTGHVTGVDMTDAQLDVARAHEAWHAERFGYEKPNTRFVKGYLEQLGELDLEPGSFDLIISNCVINLSPQKGQVFAEAFRVLKPGGRLAISDTVTTATLPAEVQADLALHAACISGAATIAELEAILAQSGFTQIAIQPKEESRAIVRDWVPGARLDDYILSATIEAIKPV